MLLKVTAKEDRKAELRHMSVSKFPEMALFRTDIIFPIADADVDGDGDGDKGRIIVTYTPPPNHTHMNIIGEKKLEIPLQPDINGLNLKELQVTLHGSPTRAYDMGPQYNDWFSACFGYSVILVYLGPHSRRVLGSFAPLKRTSSWNLSVNVNMSLGTSGVLVEGVAVVMVLWMVLVYGYGYGSVSGWFFVAAVVLRGLFLFKTATAAAATGTKATDKVKGEEREEAYITFADCAPYLITSTTSLQNVSARLAGFAQMDMTKFRPNIVVSGAETAFEEDFWTELTIASNQDQKEKENKLLLTANCVRCTSINVDYSTGKMGKGEEGSVLKKLMKDRRVDTGARFSPVFGRYAFLPRSQVEKGLEVRVGDEVVVSGRAEVRSVYGEYSALIVDIVTY